MSSTNCGSKSAPDFSGVRVIRAFADGRARLWLMFRGIASWDKLTIMTLLVMTLGLWAGHAQAQGWSDAANLTDARRSHTSTLLANGKVLIAGGMGSSGILASAQIYDPATNTWSAASNMPQARFFHTATLLPDGKVLIVGGSASGVSIMSAHVYDPANNTWSAAANLTTARHSHTATLLPNGNVLIAGGYGSNALASAQIYNPSSNTWSPEVNMTTARFKHSATLLRDGTVMVAGGEGSGPLIGNFLTSAQVFDPSNNSWGPEIHMTTARINHTATLLPNGKVFIAGGFGFGGALMSAQIYDPSNNSWGSEVNLGTARYWHTATLLPNGKVLLAGGYNGGALNNAQLYDWFSNTWSNADSLTTSRDMHTATLLPNGNVLVAGGETTGQIAVADVELYDSASYSWAAIGNLTDARFRSTATLLPSGKVLVAGGTGNGIPVPGAQLFDPANSSWSPAANMLVPRNWPKATLLTNGKVLLTGGANLGVYLTNAAMYDPVADSWSETSPVPTGFSGHTATLLRNGKVLVAGGINDSGPLSSAYLYDPVSDIWSGAGSLNVGRSQHTATLLPDGRVLVVGGYNGAYLSNAQLYDPQLNSWSDAANPGIARSLHTETLLPNGKVLIAGGFNQGNLVSAQLYDPAANSWSNAANMGVAGGFHTATLLPNGKVLTAGGFNGVYHARTHVYDPGLNSWSDTGNMLSTRAIHSAILLPNGKVLVAGGVDINGVAIWNAEIFSDASDVSPSRKPVLNAPPNNLLLPGATISLGGTQLHGDSEAGSGDARSSASNLPLVQLRRLDSGAVSWLSPTSSTATSYTSAALPVQPLQAHAGWYWATAFVNGMASNAVLMLVPLIPQAPGNVVAAAGQAAALVSFTAPADDGGAAVTGYLVKTYAASDTGTVVGQQTCSSLECLVTGLANDTAYVFTVQAVNVMGEGAVSPFSAPVTPTANNAAPTSLMTVTGDEQVTLSWTAPAQVIGVTITGYTVTAYTTGNPPQATSTCSTSATPPDVPATSCTVAGLSNGTPYNFTVQVVTTAGPGTSASSTAPVSPVASVHVPGDGSLPNGRVGQSYGASVTPAGGVAPYHFTITSGQLPAGLGAAMSADGASIIISGTPTQAETQAFTVSISDSTVPELLLMKAGPTIPTLEQTFSITVDAAAPTIAPVPLFDGPWEKLLLSLALVGAAAWGVRMRRVN